MIARWLSLSLITDNYPSPENILLMNHEDFTTIKVADFGLSTIYSEDVSFQSYNQRVGTLTYLSPEQLQGLEYSKVMALRVQSNRNWSILGDAPNLKLKRTVHSVPLSRSCRV